MKITDRIKLIFSKKKPNPNWLIHPDTPSWAKRADIKYGTKINNTIWKQ